MKEEEEKLHLEQQQLQHYDVYYYTKKNLRNSLFYYYKVDCWIWEWERDYGRNIMWIPVILIEHFFLLPSKLKSKKSKNQFFFEKKKKLFCFFLLPLSECNCNARWNCCEQRRIKNFLWRNTLPRAIDGIKLITLILRGAWIILFLNHFFQ